MGWARNRRTPGRLLPNDVSVALLFQAPGFSAIFGADLEETPGNGWSNVLGSSIALKNAECPTVLKVAHHGSANADCPALWEVMKKPTAILAPFKRGSLKIPTTDDVARILEQTDAAYSTSSFRSHSIKRLARVDKVLFQHGIRRRELYPENGHIRLRVDTGGSIDVALFQSAVHLSQVH